MQPGSATPHSAHLAGYSFSDRLCCLSEPNSARAEVFSTLRNHVLSAHLRLGRRSLAFCSATENVGCSFTAANLAVAISQAGVKTLLIDGNLRRPALHEYFQPEQGNVPGLLQALSGPDLPLSHFTQAEVLPNLSLLLAGGVDESPQALLAGTRFRRLVDAALRDFDLTLIDTPSADIGDDGRRTASLMRYTMVVLRREKSRLADVRRLITSLNDSGAQVIGTFLNDF